MKIVLCCLTIGICMSVSGNAQPASIPHKVFLISNLADVPARNGYWDHLQQLLTSQSGPYTLVVNGDILTKSFDPANQEDLGRIEHLVGLAQDLSQGRIVIIPGDRDWDNSGIDGLRSVKSWRIS